MEELTKKIEEVLNKYSLLANKEKNMIIAEPQVEDYKDLPQHKFKTEVEVTNGFYKGLKGIIVSERQEVPELIDREGNKTNKVIIKYGVSIDNHDDTDKIVVEIDARHLKVI